MSMNLTRTVEDRNGTEVVRLTVKRIEGEWRVLVTLNSRRKEAHDYFADDKRDAIDTLEDMHKRYAKRVEKKDRNAVLARNKKIREMKAAIEATVEELAEKVDELQMEMEQELDNLDLLDTPTGKDFYDAASKLDRGVSAARNFS